MERERGRMSSRERERERENEFQRERERERMSSRERERERVCVLERKRERERERRKRRKRLRNPLMHAQAPSGRAHLEHTQFCLASSPVIGQFPRVLCDWLIGTWWSGGADGHRWQSERRCPDKKTSVGVSAPVKVVCWL